MNPEEPKNQKQVVKRSRKYRLVDLPWVWLIFSFVGYVFLGVLGTERTPFENRHLDLGLSILLTVINIAFFSWTWQPTWWRSGLLYGFSLRLMFWAFSAKLVLAGAGAGAWAGAWAVPLHWAWSMPGAVALAWALGRVRALAWAFAWFWAVGFAGNAMIFLRKKDFGKLHTFLITSSTALAGLGLGWVAAQIWPLKLI